MTSARVYFRNTELDPNRCREALLIISTPLRNYVAEWEKTHHPRTTTKVSLVEKYYPALLVEVLGRQGDFPHPIPLEETIRIFIATCQEPEIKGFELTTDILFEWSTDVAGGGIGQLHGDLFAIPIRSEF